MKKIGPKHMRVNIQNYGLKITLQITIKHMIKIILKYGQKIILQIMQSYGLKTLHQLKHLIVIGKKIMYIVG